MSVGDSHMTLLCIYCTALYSVFRSNGAHRETPWADEENRSEQSPTRGFGLSANLHTHTHPRKFNLRRASGLTLLIRSGNGDKMGVIPIVDYNLKVFRFGRSVQSKMKFITFLSQSQGQGITIRVIANTQYLEQDNVALVTGSTKRVIY